MSKALLEKPEGEAWTWIEKMSVAVVICKRGNASEWAKGAPCRPLHGIDLCTAKANFAKAIFLKPSASNLLVGVLRGLSYLQATLCQNTLQIKWIFASLDGVCQKTALRPTNLVLGEAGRGWGIRRLALLFCSAAMCISVCVLVLSGDEFLFVGPTSSLTLQDFGLFCPDWGSCFPCCSSVVQGWSTCLLCCPSLAWGWGICFLCCSSFALG